HDSLSTNASRAPCFGRACHRGDLPSGNRPHPPDSRTHGRSWTSTGCRCPVRGQGCGRHAAPNAARSGSGFRRPWRGWTRLVQSRPAGGLRRSADGDLVGIINWHGVTAYTGEPWQGVSYFTTLRLPVDPEKPLAGRSRDASVLDGDEFASFN